VKLLPLSNTSSPGESFFGITATTKCIPHSGILRLLTLLKLAPSCPMKSGRLASLELRRTWTGTTPMRACSLPSLQIQLLPNMTGAWFFPQRSSRWTWAMDTPMVWILRAFTDHLWTMGQRLMTERTNLVRRWRQRRHVWIIKPKTDQRHIALTSLSAGNYVHRKYHHADSQHRIFHTDKWWETDASIY
jgi:hypothetical protein